MTRLAAWRKIGRFTKENGSLIGEQRALSTEMWARVAQLEGEGMSATQTADLLASEYKAEYPDWANIGTVPNAVRQRYAEP